MPMECNLFVSSCFGSLFSFRAVRSLLSLSVQLIIHILCFVRGKLFHRFLASSNLVPLERVVPVSVVVLKASVPPMAVLTEW